MILTLSSDMVSLEEKRMYLKYSTNFVYFSTLV